MACPGSPTSGFGWTSFTFSKDGSNLCVSYTLGGGYNASNVSFPLTDTDLAIADAIVQDIRANLSAGDLANLVRGRAIEDLVMKAIIGS